MGYISFILQIIVISLTGVMLPGPMTAVALGKGSDSANSGLLLTVGHAIVEVPLIILIFFGFGFLFQFFYIKLAIGILGALFLSFTGINMFISLKKTAKDESGKGNASPLVSGIILSAGNPLFFIWWMTVGNVLIFKSYNFGLAALIAFIIIHLFCDALWLFFLSFISFRGGKFFGRNFQKVVFLICGILLLFFSGIYIYDTVKFAFKF